MFICGSLAPGEDGVGDYTRMLAAQLVRTGNNCTIISTHDKKASTVSEEIQRSGEIEIAVSRIPLNEKQGIRRAEAKRFVSRLNPDIISLQFVTYSFHPKGLCFGIGKLVRSVASNRPVHVMFHETWPSVPGADPLQSFVYGMQEYIVRQLPKTTQADVLTTQLPTSRLSLSQYNVQMLPIFGNIPVAKSSPRNLLRKDNHLRAVVFGSAPSREELKPAFERLDRIAETVEQQVIIQFAGRNGAHGKSAVAYAEAYYGKINVKVYGVLDEISVGDVFNNSDIGLVKDDTRLLGKSGSAISMMEHGLPIIVRGEIEHANYLAPRFRSLVLTVDDPTDRIPQRQASRSSIPDVAEQWVRLVSKVIN